MEPKLKAKELIEKFIELIKVFNIKHIWVEDIDAAKQCALIAVDYILKSKKQDIIHFYRCGNEFCECGGYWQEVKQEIIYY